MAAPFGLFTVALVMAFALLLMETVEGADPSQLVTNLPGAPSGLNFTQYAGHVTVDETNGRALFYWFFTADTPDASSKPLALWLNGGPGGSSIGYGLLKELGPFYPDGTPSTPSLSLNENSWIKEANIIFLESPVPIGFSYSNTSSDYFEITDQRTAEDSLQFLLNWYKKFPEYKTNELYLIGESYAGHYLPNLAKEIVRYNDAQECNGGGSQLNIKGWLVGNPWTDAYYNNLAAAEWWYTHDLISDEVHKALIQSCDFAVDQPVLLGDPNTACQQAVRAAYGNLNFLDTSNIYAPKFPDQVCAEDLVCSYLNQPEVQEALHVQSKINWEGISVVGLTNYSKTDKLQSMLPIYEELMARGLRMWIYHGDSDATVPTTATRYALASMGLDVLKPWYPWVHDTQVGGYATIYKGLTFATVRDAGHNVPADQPGRALSIFKHYLADSELPNIFNQGSFTIRKSSQ